jgi:hypothetical protein
VGCGFFDGYVVISESLVGDVPLNEYLHNSLVNMPLFNQTVDSDFVVSYYYTSKVSYHTMNDTYISNVNYTNPNLP